MYLSNRSPHLLSARYLLATALLIFIWGCSDSSGSSENIEDTNDTVANNDVVESDASVTTDSSSEQIIDATPDVAVSPDEGSAPQDTGESVEDAVEDAMEVEADSTDDASATTPDTNTEPPPNSWCRYQWPLEKAAVPNATFEAYVRIFVQGITDLSAGVDTDAKVIAELGFGPDGSMPSGNPSWIWTQGAPQATWNADEQGEANNDEYTATLSAPSPGVYDLAGRLSVDGGVNWIYCDGDGGFEHDGSEDGYQTERSGHLQVTDPCIPNPCTTPPAATCAPNGVELTIYPDAGACAVENDAASCTYAPALQDCSASEQICKDGACTDPTTLPSPSDIGAVRITEIMAVVDNGDAAEWIELSNPGDEAVDLEDCTITVAPGTTHKVEQFLHIPAHGAIVMASSDDPDDNYGISWSYVYNGIDLPDDGATLTFKCGDTLIDEVSYTAEIVSENISLQLDAAALDAAQGEEPDEWCPGTTPYGTHDLLGTPGQPNLPCPKIEALSWCRLQWPLDEKVAVGGSVTAYARIHHPGVTDLSDGVDANELILVQAGLGSDGATPTDADDWVWVSAEANAGWSASAANEPNNDEYQASISPTAAGTFDLAFRASADGGLSWTWCDAAAGVGADGSENGYQPENAGSITVGALKVLFVGNSYTSANDLADMVEEMIEGGAYGGPVETDDITQGGAQLYDHLQNDTLLSNIASGEWTHVVLQEQSYLPVLYADNFYASANALSDLIQEADAQVVFFETWARKEGNSLYDDDLAGYDPTSMQAALKTAYSNAASTNSGVYAPVGDAWELSLAENPNISLHSGDGSHPSQAGSYLAACVFYASLTGESPVGNTVYPSSLSESEAATLQSIAAQLIIP